MLLTAVWSLQVWFCLTEDVWMYVQIWNEVNFVLMLAKENPQKMHSKAFDKF